MRRLSSSIHNLILHLVGDNTSYKTHRCFEGEGLHKHSIKAMKSKVHSRRPNNNPMQGKNY